jgi:hypothetical protein
MYLNKWKRSLNHFRLGYLSSTAHRLLTRSRPTSNQPMASAHKDRARAPGPTGTARRFSRPSRRPQVLAAHVRHPPFHSLILYSTPSRGEVLVHFSLSLSPSFFCSPSRHALLFTSPHEAFALTSCAHHRVMLPTNAATSPSHRTASATAPLRCGHHVDSSRIW